MGATTGMKTTLDTGAVRDCEHAGWQRGAGQYDARFARASAQFVEPLLDAAGVAAGTKVLDLCCGTGLVAAAAARRGAVPTGVDFSSAMLIQARRARPYLPFHEGDAQALAYPHCSFAPVVPHPRIPP